MSRVILFDVNETLLDTAALEPEFERMLGDGTLRSRWFLTLQEIQLTSLLLGSYVDFARMARAALRMVARGEGSDVSPEDEERLLERLLELPPYPEVDEALRLLRDGGARLAALSNGLVSSVEHQLRSAGIADHFEAVLSADEVVHLKPAREPYLMAARRLGVEIGEVRLVACHAWDIAGAAAAGCATAFVHRPGKAPNPLLPPPDLEGSDLLDVARRILDAGVE